MSGEFRLKLDRAPDDPEVSSPEFQRDVNALKSEMKAAGIDYRQRHMTFDAVGVSGHPLADFAIAMSPVVIELIKLVETWIKSRPGRKARITKGGVTVEVDNVDDLPKLGPLLREEDDEAR